ncbi:ABC transporter permease [Clostridium botulinum]|uniref:Branched-chain amino acid ABC transporter permease n=1 Tax=Clostridium botulinum C/D str. DC5 TaxID=1443128 RepID=A0A0A0IBP4_CLOBO|nr:ABC transporter permease [Clostridium botulinum]KEI06624.1 branched-chain amino acid ABC transporter permease [Clostridium botulinum C/D str. BKT75002]KEI09536.1 branched-chain amino acid ABC transporter permease [Clostridium botulinum C/D str. BKT2873]KGM94444.1 branched-chain amino acid ABC transporter permease [Clostridium botulinum D str. CCUG 7971]KGM98884.1 branched-chain amino acid ABC transporter permease [Clostridium botulinum C/D str. DC5]KOC50067.1 branched-chain amino acid ABC t
MSNGMIVALIAATLRTAAPLIFAALGGVFSEKSGVVNIGLEGMMIMGAFFGVLGTHETGSPLIGILCAMLAGGAISLVHAFLSINLRADQIISGTAINLFALALASFLIGPIFKTGGQTNVVAKLSYNLPGFLKKVPILNNLNWFVILALILVFVSHFVLYKTAFGLRIRAVGEHPSAADTMGINVYKMRYICVIISGILAGLGGATLSIGMTPLYKEGMVAGRGFIALAAMIFGNWKPIGTMGACMLFAFGTAFQMIAQGFSINLPNEFYQSIPYILTMLALAGFVGKTECPKADGKPYIKGER